MLGTQTLLAALLRACSTMYSDAAGSIYILHLFKAEIDFHPLALLHQYWYASDQALSGDAVSPTRRPDAFVPSSPQHPWATALSTIY